MTGSTDPSVIGDLQVSLSEEEHVFLLYRHSLCFTA